MKAKRRLKNFDFSVEGAHVALVKYGANGQSILVKKAFSDSQKWDSEKQQYVPRTESGIRVNLSLEDALMIVRDLCYNPDAVELLTSSIQKSANGAELVAVLEKAEPAVADFAARKEQLKGILERLNKADLEQLASFVNLNSKPHQVEKSNMTQTAAVTPEAVQKQIADALAAQKAASDAEIAKLNKALTDSEAARTAAAADVAVLKAAHDRAEAAAFVTKATTLKSIGFGKDQTEATIGAAMQKLAKVAPAEYALVEAMLTTAADTISKGAALETIGADGQPSTVSKASERLQKAADDLKASMPNSTPEQRVAKALENDPTLYQ